MNKPSPSERDREPLVLSHSTMLSLGGALSLGCSKFAEDWFWEFRDLGFGKLGFGNCFNCLSFIFVFIFIFVLIGLTNRVGIGLIGFRVMFFSF
jgi:hypothetical protein